MRWRLPPCGEVEEMDDSRLTCVVGGSQPAKLMQNVRKVGRLPISHRNLTSRGINCEQYGITFSSAPTLLYWSRISGRATPFRLQALNLNTGIPSLVAAMASGSYNEGVCDSFYQTVLSKCLTSRPFLSGTVNTPTTVWPFFLIRL